MSDFRQAEAVTETETVAPPVTEEVEEEVQKPIEGPPPGATTSLWSDAWKELRTSPLFLVSLGLVVLFIVMAIAPQLFTSTDPRACSLSNSLERPSSEHWFGFDLQGCDYYARSIYGARISMAIGVTVIGFAAILAVILGSISGYYGGWLDSVIARLTDIWFAIPTILGGIVILSLLGERGFFQVSFVLVILGWPTMLRLYRSSVLSVKEMDYVEAARALGASDFRILLKHILPNAITPVIIYAAISIGVIIAAEAALSFLGVGLQLPAISWGLMISGAQTRILQAPHLLLFPGLFLSLAVFGFILMGDALRDALDPKGR
ncbi:MAG: ABC transporter permease [Acidimicrobiia bacterium]|nr:ABC transporter permease [Acidimicrobiia bacterium]